jgi:hypothetical protein
MDISFFWAECELDLLAWGQSSLIQSCKYGSKFSDFLNVLNFFIYKIWGFHGGGYEKFRLLEYKTPVNISQETHYFPATELSRLMLCKV